MTALKPYGLSRDERLRGKTRIDRLFKDGRSVISFPYRAVFAENDTGNVAIMVSIPKKGFKHAVDRNLLRRRTKETYRLNKIRLMETLNGKGLDIAIIYIDKNITETPFLQKKMCGLLDKIAVETTKVLWEK
ncbi:MAG: ribonuclease P protein component [Bacteroidales bacterium]